MRMLKKATVALVTAGSLTVLGAGVANAADDEAKKPAKKPSVVVNELNQSQTCTYKALIPINVALLNMDSAVGSFSCTQAGSIG